MSTDVLNASAMVERVESLQAARLGKPVGWVREGIAKRLKTTKAVLRDIRRKRRKRVESWLMRGIVGELIEEATRELTALEHDLQLARQIGLDPRHDAYVAAKAKAKALLDLIEEATGSK